MTIDSETVRSQSAKEWLDAIRDHDCGDKHWMVHDDPRNRMAGYQCEGCGLIAEIKLGSIKRLDGMSEMQQDVFKSAMRNHEGREGLAKAANVVAIPPPPKPEPDPLKVMIVPTPDECTQIAHTEPEASNQKSGSGIPDIEEELAKLQEQAVQRERKEFDGIVLSRMGRFRAALNKHFAWTFHNLIAHPLSEIVHLVGLSRLSDWIHEASMPPDH